MYFPDSLPVDMEKLNRFLGYGNTLPDPQNRVLITSAATEVAGVVRPRWAYAGVELEPRTERIKAPHLQGKDIEKHLAECKSAIYLALTLGAGIDRIIRTASAVDMQKATLLDAAASTLAEQYADYAETLLREDCTKKRGYLTGRFSPGYGDFPLNAQAGLLRVLDAERKIGLTTSNGILIPGKSITAVLGVAQHPVSGCRAGCETCDIAEICRYKRSSD